MNKILILDTNVLLTEPGSLYRFANALVIIPQTVLQELDKIKLSRADKVLQYNGRLVSRYLFSLSAAGSLSEGVELENGSIIKVGNLNSAEEIPATLKTKFSDDQILALAHQVQKKNPESEVILVTNDLNMLLKAQSLDLKTEYHRGPDTGSRIKRFFSNQAAIIKKNPMMALFIVLILGGIIAIILFLSRSLSSMDGSIKGPPELVAQVQLFESKESQYQKLLEKDPGDQRALFGLVELHVEMGRYYQDSEHYDKAIDLIEQSPKTSARNFRKEAAIARLHFNLGMNDIAASELNKIARAQSGPAFDAIVEQAHKLSDYQEWRLAIIFLNKAVAVKPKDTATRIDLAKAYYENNQAEKTIKELHKVLEIDDKNAVVYYNLGFAYWQKRSDATTAISYFEKFLELEPTSGLAKQARENIKQIKKELKG